MGLISTAEQSGAFAAASDPAQDVYLVPAFVGLGAPYWDPNCRGAIFGLTRSTGPKELARAALESVCYQSLDLFNAMRADWPLADMALRVDGGMTASDWLMQRLADILNLTIDRPMIKETTAVGAAYLAGLKSGIYPSPADFALARRGDRSFEPGMSAAARSAKIAGWRAAVSRTLSAATP